MATTHIYSEHLTTPKSRAWRMAKCSCGWARMVNGVALAHGRFQAHVIDALDDTQNLPIDPTGRNWDDRQKGSA